MTLTSLYQSAILLIDKAYQVETNIEKVEGKSYPKEYLYSIRMVEELLSFKPGATELELLAARCQHLYRWDIPRNDYPVGRKGYHDWRGYLYQYQAGKAAEIMQHVGYDEKSINEVKQIVSKQHIKLNVSAQLIEDVACLVFLKYYISDFVKKHQDDKTKLVRIIHRTWGKMSKKGQEAALQLNIDPDLLKLILKALEQKS